MRTAVLSVAALTILAWLGGDARAQPFGKKGKKAGKSASGWLSSLSQGKALARQTGKPLMVVIRCVP
jgi:hypothetical protein